VPSCSSASSKAWAAAGSAPVEQAILVDTFPPAKRGAAMSVYGMAVVLAPAIGPTLGGFITEHLSWRWVFLINVPVGLLSLYLTNRLVSDPPHLADMRRRSGGVDYVGLGLIALALGCLELVLDKGQEDDWFHSPTITGFAVVAAVALVAFVVWEWNQKLARRYGHADRAPARQPGQRGRMASGDVRARRRRARARPRSTRLWRRRRAAGLVRLLTGGVRAILRRAPRREWDRRHREDRDRRA
jgi:hypothetical protein